jgi:hypothetical protein
MDLTGPDHEAVPKTVKGAALGAAFRPDPRKVDMYHGYSGRILVPDYADEIPEPLVLDDYFVITKRGKYQLRFELFCVKKSGGKLAEFHLPVTVEVELKNP